LPEIEGLFEKLKLYEQYRHFMAHGLCIVAPNPSDPLITFHLWRPGKDGTQLGTIEIGMQQMRENTEEIAKYSNRVVRLFYRVYLEQNLQIPVEAFGPSTNG
jgi:hypothetical protein